MSESEYFQSAKEYFNRTITEYGRCPKGVDWNSEAAQKIRFDQLLKIVVVKEYFGINHFGCGYGALYDYLKAGGYDFSYCGYDIAEEMVDVARKSYSEKDDCAFYDDKGELAISDYTVASGIFNLRFGMSDIWMESYLISTVEEMVSISRKGVAFNALTAYSDKERMREDLYYPEPCAIFDKCIRKFGRSVALLHDYGLFDFTILIRK